MAKRLAERLAAVRDRLFVGRADAVKLFEAAVGAAAPPFHVLWVTGPGGVGKTTLLRAFAAACRRHDVPCRHVDGHYVDPSPESFLGALRAVGADERHPPAVSGARADRQVIFVDSYEMLAPLDDWVRDVWLPDLPADALVVVASSAPPSLAWRADPGWQSLLHVLSLRNLTPEDSRAYLTVRDLPPGCHQDILDLTYGHPLALSLVADAWASGRGAPDEPVLSPDLIATLLRRLVRDVPTPWHRAALEASSIVRLTTEPLLSELLGIADVREVFDWLRGLSFLEAHQHGLFPHDLVREAVLADLRWRNPERYTQLHRAASGYYARRLRETRGQAQRQVLFDYAFLHHDSPIRSMFEWHDHAAGAPDGLRDDDVPDVLAMAVAHEGDDAARLAAHWLTRQPENAIVYRDQTGRPAGFLIIVELRDSMADDVQDDPAIRAAWAYLDRHAPLRATETAAVFRFWMTRDTYQAVSATQSRIFVSMVQYYLTTPGLAVTFLPCADPAAWEPGLRYGDLSRIPAADFVMGGRSYGVFGHDWRTTPPDAWLDLLAEREVATEPLERLPPADRLVVLSEPAFEDAVRAALRDFTRTDALQHNPLLRSRLVIERAGTPADGAAGAAALRSLVTDAADLLQANPREAKWYRALYHTYIKPAATQERAAALLAVPFSSYRRHLSSGVAHVVNTLWRWEIRGHGENEEPSR
jgi:hypothetical protein